MKLIEAILSHFPSDNNKLISLKVYTNYTMIRPSSLTEVALKLKTEPRSRIGCWERILELTGKEYEVEWITGIIMQCSDNTKLWAS